MIRKIDDAETVAEEARSEEPGDVSPEDRSRETGEPTGPGDPAEGRLPSDGPVEEGDKAEDKAGPESAEETGEVGEAGESAADGDQPLRYRLEALLFASGDVMPVARLAKVLGLEQAAVKEALEQLRTEWVERVGAVELVEIAGGWRFMTRPSFHDTVGRLARKGKVERLSPAALETLAIVAYRQPLTRAEVEVVRGVQAGPLLRVLLDRDLIRVTGRSPEPGHPLLYGTTKRFLDHFGLKSLKHLPDLKDLVD